jgi:hypothetical protein
MNATPGVATVYEHVNFSGRSQALNIGRFDISQLTVGNDNISSLRVPPGFVITLYEHGGFQGRSKKFASDAAYVGDDFNDITSSIVVEAIPMTIPGGLTDFNLCLALSQKAINRQLATAWEIWKRNSGFTDSVRIFWTEQNGRLIESQRGLEARIDPIMISLNVPDGRLGQVRVTLRLPSGKVRYFDEFDGRLVDYPFENWSVSYLTDLEKIPVTPASLQKTDPEAYKVAQSVISRQSNSVFSIEYLFMKFTEVGLMVTGNKQPNIPDRVDEAARNQALACLKLLLNGELNGSKGGYLLGTVVHRTNPPGEATFALTDFLFNVQSNTQSAEAATLSYLGQVANQPMPADANAARIRTPHVNSWVPAPMLDGTQGVVDGVMAISRTVFFDKYLLPQFTRRIGKRPAINGLTYSFGDVAKHVSNTSDIIKRYWTSSTSWSLSLTPRVGTNRIEISGQVTSSAHMDGVTHGAEWQTEWIYVDGHQELVGAVELTGGGDCVGFKLQPGVSYTFKDVVIDRNEVGGGAKVLQAFSEMGQAMGLSGSTVQGNLQSAQQANANNIRRWLNEILNGINIDLSSQAFIPPGGSIQTFVNPRFSVAGDLLFDIVSPGARLVVSPSLPGNYECHLYDNRPEKNNWHYVTLVRTSDTTLKWTNRAGASWTLTTTSNRTKLDVGEDCPYFKEGHTQVTVVWSGNQVLGLYGPGNALYDRDRPASRI